MTTQDGPAPTFEDEIAPLWKWAIRAIGLIATVLGGLFAWVQLREIPLPPIENAQPTYIRRIVLAFYYACWVAGTTVDANIQKEVYRRDPQHGNIPREATLAVVGLFAVGALLLWASTSDERISLALIPFLVANIIAWRILVRRVNPIAAATSCLYLQAHQYDRLEQLRVITAYITGWWQWARFGIMALTVVFANIFVFSPQMRATASGQIKNLMQSTTVDAISNLLPVAALVLFVLIAEAWIWSLRLRNAIALRTIELLGRKYTLRPSIRQPDTP